SHLDRSADPAFLKVTSDAPLFEPVFFRGGKAYLTFAVVTAGASGLRVFSSVDAHSDGAAIAVIDLSFIQDALSAAIERTRIGPGASGGVHVSDGRGNTVSEITPLINPTGPMLQSSARIDPLGWSVTIEQPNSLIFTRLNSLLVGSLLIVAALL